MKRLAVTWLAATAISVAVATDYCTSDLCHNGGRHIACGHNGMFAAACPSDAAMVNMTDLLRTLLVSAHNEKRNFVASGADAKHSAACRMATIKWDDELASMAALNVKQCAMKHDACRNTATYRQSGQNLFWISYFGAPNYGDQLQAALDFWFGERKHSNMDYIRSYHENPANRIGHFTVMMADKNTHLGCAAATYTVRNASYKAMLLACNYATANVLGQRVYENCTTPGRHCSSGMNPRYNCLCAASEVYAVARSTSLQLGPASESISEPTETPTNTENAGTELEKCVVKSDVR